MAYKKAGIDLSYCQKNIDWNKVVTDFAIIRAGYGKYVAQKDEMFESHYSALKKKNVPTGAYWYSYAMTEAEAKEEAKVCIQILKGKKFEYPIYYDVENQNQYNLGKAKVSAIIKAFCAEMEKAGYWVGVYTNTNWYLNVITDDIKTRYAIWIAHWDVSKPGISGPYGVWQYKVGTVQGIPGRCDMDYSYVDYPTKIKESGKNGYPAPTPTPPKKKTISMTCTVDGITYTGTLTQK